MELVAVWEQGDLQKSYSKIADRIAELNERNAAFVANASASKPYLHRVGNHVIQPGDGTASLKPEVESIFGFLDRVGFCVKHEICSRRVALEYFGEASTSMFDYFGNFVSERRKTVPSFARASETMIINKP